MNVSENVIQEKPDSIWEEKGSNISNDELCNILKPVRASSFNKQYWHMYKNIILIFFHTTIIKWGNNISVLI